MINITGGADELEYKLTLEFEPCEDQILSRATYDPTTFSERQINLLLHQVDEIVEYLVRHIDCKIDTISLCFSPDTLSIANPFPKNRPFTHGPAYAVERWSSETPDKEAVVLGSVSDGVMSIAERLTYFELNRRANQLAHALLEQGAGGDGLICVLMEKSLNLYVSILAVLKVGCGYLPIVPGSPAERTSKILADAEVKICITESSASSDIRDMGSFAVLNLDLCDFSQYSNENPTTRYEGSHLAYAVFTSGSTGTPKGVLVTQDNLMSNIEFLHGLYPTSSQSRLLQACSQAFDVSVFEIFFTWYAGMCLCTATKDDVFRDLVHAINSLGVTHLSLTPTVASLINPKEVPGVMFLVTAGEALTENVRRQWVGKGLHQGWFQPSHINFLLIVE